MNFQIWNCISSITTQYQRVDKQLNIVRLQIMILRDFVRLETGKQRLQALLPAKIVINKEVYQQKDGDKDKKSFMFRLVTAAVHAAPYAKSPEKECA